VRPGLTIPRGGGKGGTSLRWVPEDDHHAHFVRVGSPSPPTIKRVPTKHIEQGRVEPAGLGISGKKGGRALEKETQGIIIHVKLLVMLPFQSQSRDATISGCIVKRT